MTEPAPTSILLVDDERSLREPLAEYLTRQGFVVREADSAAQARGQASSKPTAATYSQVFFVTMRRHAGELQASPRQRRRTIRER